MRKPGKAETEFVVAVEKLSKKLRKKDNRVFCVFDTDGLKGRVVSAQVTITEPATHLPKGSYNDVILPDAMHAGLNSRLVCLYVAATYELTPKRVKKAPHPNLTKKRKAWSAGKMRSV
jgi:hypothetical protein